MSSTRSIKHTLKLLIARSLSSSPSGPKEAREYLPIPLGTLGFLQCVDIPYRRVGLRRIDGNRASVYGRLEAVGHREEVGTVDARSLATGSKSR